MLDIYITEKDIVEKKRLREMCLKYLVNRDYEAEIYEYSSDIIPSSAAIFVLALDDSLSLLSRAIHEHNNGNYIVVMINDYKEMKKAVTPAVCPAGILIRPCSRNELETVLDEVYADYIRCTGSNTQLGNFTFRQKAREYSIPYEKIIYFESRNKKIIVRTETQELEFYDTLSSVLENVPECFMQIHKSFVVNVSRIMSADYGAMTVEFDDGSSAFMSRTYKCGLKDRLNERSTQ